MKLSELLGRKEFKYRVLATVKPEETVLTAVERLAEHDRGSLPVCTERGELVGIITERDIVRKFFARRESNAKNTRVKDIMSTQVIIGTPDDDLSYAISVMKDKRIRHLPVVDKGRVLGVISMRDLLGVELEECTLNARFLSDYISGGYAGTNP